MVKNMPANAGGVGLIPESGRSPGEGNGYLPHYSSLENSMDRGSWQDPVLEVAKSRTPLSDLTSLLLGRKVMTNLDSIFKSRDITLPTKVRLVKAMVFPVVVSM